MKSWQARMELEIIELEKRYNALDIWLKQPKHEVIEKIREDSYSPEFYYASLIMQRKAMKDYLIELKVQKKYWIIR